MTVISNPARSPFKMRTLILITSHFPFGTGEPFLETELPIISGGFERVIIISQNTDSELIREIPGQCKIFRYNTTTNLAGYLGLPFLLLGNLRIIIKIYRDELAFRRGNSFKLSSKHKIILLKKIVKGLQLKRFIQYLLKREKITGSVILYSYWLKTGAHAIAMLNFRNSIKISRAHGSDLYEENNTPFFLPMLKYLSDNLDTIVFISENGMQYLKEKTGSYKSEFILSRLGVARNNPNPVQLNNKADVFNIVSCSNIIPLKRIERIIYALELIGSVEKINWVHFGDGILHEEIGELAAERLGTRKNITYSFMGQYPNRDLLEYYNKNRINLFLNTSVTEGIPVSIMEAQAFGIPAIATDVGGVREVLSEGTGILLPVDFKIDELVRNIQYFIDLPLKNENKFRINAFKNWENNFNAIKNYHDFAEKLLALLLNKQ